MRVLPVLPQCVESVASANAAFVVRIDARIVGHRVGPFTVGVFELRDRQQERVADP